MKKIIFLAIISILLSSCGASKFSLGLERIEIGMTKQEVIYILGNDYKLMGITSTPDGNLETLMFYDMNMGQKDNCIMNFLNGRLDEWHREYLSPPPPEPRPLMQNN